MCPYLRVLCSNLSMCSVECTVEFMNIWNDGNVNVSRTAASDIFSFSLPCFMFKCVCVCKYNKDVAEIVQQWYECVYVCGQELNIHALNKLWFFA